MAIDSTLFVADIPAGSYAAGDVMQLTVNAGPANVRSGRGSAILKSFVVGSTSNAAPFWVIHLKNSDWIDDMSSFVGNSGQATSFAEDCGNVQSGSNANLTPNSGWQVYAECIIGGTSTAAHSMFALIDIDYPSVSAITAPDSLVGVPTSIPLDVNITTVANGSLNGAMWSTVNVDYFKAGYEYCLTAVETVPPGNGVIFVAFSNAAGMGGLQRIVPSNANIYAIRKKITYASKLVKGPMDVKVLMVASSAAATTVHMIHDYVKRA